MRKNFIRTLAAALVIACTLSVPAWAESAVVTGNDVNLREGPGSGYRVIDTLPRDTTLNIVDRSNGSWYAVAYGNTIGFISADYVRITDAGQEIDLGGYGSYGGSGGITFSDDPWASGGYSYEQPTEQTPAAPAATQPPQGEISFGQPSQPSQPAQSGGQTAAGSAQEGREGTINAMYVRFRSGPDSNATILGEYNKGKPLVAVGSVGNWIACVIDGQSGYVFSDYVTLGASTSSSAAPSEQQTVDSFGGVLPAGTAVSPSPLPSAAPAGGNGASAAQQTIGTGVIRGNYVRFRTGPGTNYQIIDSYDQGKALDITGRSGDWTACVIDGRAGYINSNYVQVTSASSGSASQPTQTAAPAATPAPTPAPTQAPQSKKGYISGNNVRMRNGASMSAGILTELFYGNSVTITGTVGDWTAVIYNGQDGFVYSQFVKEGSLTIEGNTVSGESGGSSPAPQQTTLTGSSYEKGKQIAQFALQYVGYNYSWGGKDPSTGFDCSGLVYYTYQHFGYNINRVAQDQARNGVHVDPNNLQPGDILCFYSGSSYIGHSGIYIGDGKFVHAQNSATGVVITDLSGHYGQRGFEARRIVS